MPFTGLIEVRRRNEVRGRSLTVVIRAIAAALLATTLDAQNPDFSGTWTLLSA